MRTSRDSFDRGGRRPLAAALILAGLMLFLLGVPASAQAPSGLIAAWGLDEGNGTVAGDGSGSGNAGSVSGAAWTTQGRFGNALAFDGATSRVTGPSITLGPAFTLMAWVLNPTRTAYETMITVGESRDFYLGSGKPTLWTGNADFPFGGAITDGVWHHVAVVSDGATLLAYLDGTPWGTPRTVALGAVSGPLQVGAWIWAGGNADYFAGTIDEVRVYNRALAQGEIETVMNLPVGSSNAAVVGQWSPVVSWPIAPVHMVLQRTGTVLIFNEANGGQSARLWDPATSAFTAVPTPSNIFCAGHTLLADGRSSPTGGSSPSAAGPFPGSWLTRRKSTIPPSMCGDRSPARRSATRCTRSCSCCPTAPCSTPARTDRPDGSTSWLKAGSTPGTVSSPATVP